MVAKPTLPGMITGTLRSSRGRLCTNLRHGRRARGGTRRYRRTRTGGCTGAAIRPIDIAEPHSEIEPSSTRHTGSQNRWAHRTVIVHLVGLISQYGLTGSWQFVIAANGLGGASPTPLGVRFKINWDTPIPPVSTGLCWPRSVSPVGVPRFGVAVIGLFVAGDQRALSRGRVVDYPRQGGIASVASTADLPTLAPISDTAEESRGGNDMAGNAHYKLSGQGAEISYHADTRATEVVFDESFGEFQGTHQLGPRLDRPARPGEAELSHVGHSDENRFDLGARLTGEAAHMDFWLRGKRNADAPGTPTDAPVTGLLQTDIGGTFSEIPLTGTVSVPAG